MARYQITRMKFFEFARFCAENKIEFHLTHAGPFGIDGVFDECHASQIKAAGFWIQAI